MRRRSSAAIGVAAVLAVIVGVSLTSIGDDDASDPTNHGGRPALPALCRAFGPFQSLADVETYSLAEQVRLGESGFSDDAGEVRTSIAILASGFDADTGPAGALLRYLTDLYHHRTDGSIAPPAPTEDVVAAARIVDDTLHAGGCEGWQEQPAD